MSYKWWKIKETKLATLVSLCVMVLQPTAFIPAQSSTLNLDGESYPPFSRECSDTVITEYISKLNDPKRVEFASLALEACGQRAVPALSSIVRNLSSNSQSAAEILERIDSTVKGNERTSIVPALGKVELAAKDAVPALIAALGDRDKFVRVEAAEALGKTGPAARDAVPALVVALKKNQDDFFSSVPVSAAEALGKIGPAARDAVPALVTALRDDDEILRARAAEALGEIGPAARDAVPALAIALKKNQDDGRVRASAAEALGKIGPAAKDAGPALIAVLKADSDSSVRASAAGALGAIRPATKDATSALTSTIVNDKDYHVRDSAAEALGVLGPVAKDTISSLAASLQSEDEHIRVSSAYALGKIGQDAVPFLIKALENQKNNIRKAAAYALGEIDSPLGNNVIISLETVVKNKDDDLEVRRISASTLEKSGIDMQWFFNQNNLISPQNAVCPSISHGSYTPSKFNYDRYSGRCVVARYGTCMGCLDFSTLLDAVTKIFQGK